VADERLCALPPRNGRCTVEKIAINSVMAGAPAESMPLLCASIEAMAEPEFNLFALNTTTCCVVPGVFVNGPVRHDLEIPFGVGCFGGQAGPGPALGRAMRLLMRNVGGQLVGTTAFSWAMDAAEVMVCIAPPWAELIAVAYPAIEDVQQKLWEHASLPVTRWPEVHQQEHEKSGRVDEDGFVHLVADPDKMLV